MIIMYLVQNGRVYFQYNPLFKDHLSCGITFSGQKSWSLTTGFTIMGNVDNTNCYFKQKDPKTLFEQI